MLEEREGDSTLFQMEVEGCSHLVLWEGEVWGDNNLDDNLVAGKLEEDSHHFLSIERFEDGAKSTTPTRTRSQKWTLAEVKWYANRWNYNRNVNDKVESGEYALERPPKKPGGINRTILFLLGVFLRIDGTDGGQQEDEFDNVIFLEGGAESTNDDLISEGGTWTLLVKVSLAVTLLTLSLFREKFRRLYEEWSIAMEVMAPLTVALEKFVIKHNIDREDTDKIRSVLMKKLYREFNLSAEDDSGRKVALLFSNIEREINVLCTEGGLKREDAVESHLGKLWESNKLHARHEKIEAGSRRICLDFWSALLVAVIFLLFENVRKFYFWLWSWRIMKLLLVVAILGGIEKVYRLWEGFHTTNSAATPLELHVRGDTTNAKGRVRIQQGEEDVRDKDYTLKELFASELEGFLRHIKCGGVAPKEELLRALWDKFAHDIRIFGKKISYFETCPKELQQDTIDWFFSKTWSEIEDLSMINNRGWRNAVSLHFEKLCQQCSSEKALSRPMGRQEHSADALFKRRRKYLGAEKWKESVGLTKRQVEPQSEAVEDRGITVNDGGTVLFGTARNVFPDGVSEVSSCKQPSAVVKRAGWVDQRTCELYHKDVASRLEVEGSAEIITFREDSGGKDNDMVVNSAFENCGKEEDDATEMTVEGSLGADSNISSEGNSVGAGLVWSMTVNGTRYVGHSRPTGNSSFLNIADGKEDCSELLVETTKERNRRLLVQERISQAGREKVKKTRRSVRHSNQIQTLLTVEEDGSVEGSSVEGRSVVIDVAEEKKPTICDGLREVKLVLRTKVRWSRITKNVRCSQRKKIKARRLSIRGAIVGHWKLATREFSYIIRLFSCSAMRYATFRSNRRFKPGD